VNAVVFLGPSLDVETARKHLDATYRPPVRMGELFQAARSKPDMIGIIDGYFEQTPAVWHKEILYALANGIRVFGGSSMGALRAAELHAFGMKGVGKIFEDFASGALEDDDEVAVVHAPGETRYGSQSEAMVNLRYGLRAAMAEGVINDEERCALVSAAKARFYPDRSWPVVFSAARDLGLGEARVKALRQFVATRQPNQKRDDAIAVLKAMSESAAAGSGAGAPTFDFERTKNWERVERYFSSARGGTESDTTFEKVRNHIRLAHPDRERLRERALLLMLVDREARRIGVDAIDTKGAMARFRQKRGLFSPGQLTEWMEQNCVSKAECLELVRLEATLDEVASRTFGAVDTYLARALKLEGGYGEVAKRVEEKWRAQGQGVGPIAADGEVAIEQAIAWYRSRFGAFFGSVGEHASELGFESERQFLDELSAEYSVQERAAKA
jgi:hypothetical protein